MNSTKGSVARFGNCFVHFVNTHATMPAFDEAWSRLRCASTSLLILSLFQLPSLSGIFGTIGASNILCCGGTDQVSAGRGYGSLALDNMLSSGYGL